MSDDETPVVRKPVKTVKPISDSDDDDAPVVRKPTAKKTVKPPSSDDDDDVPVVHKPTAKKAKKPVDEDSDEDAAPVTKKPSAKQKKQPVDIDDEDDEVVTTRKPRGRVHVDPGRLSDSDEEEGAVEKVCTADLVDLIDYDSMSFDAFVAHLKKQSKPERIEEKRRIEEDKAATASSADDDRHFDGTQAYSYTFMLDRVIAIREKDNPELAEQQRIKLPMPKLEKQGSKRTALVNFRDICLALNRSEEEVKDYIEKTLTVQGSIDGNHCLILKYQNAKVAQFEKLFGKYVEEYVMCRACHHGNTTLKKDVHSRLLVMLCKDCKAERNIQTAGVATFKAQTTKRSKQRNKMA